MSGSNGESVRRALFVAATVAAVCCVLASCTSGRDRASGRLLTRGEPVPTSIADAPPAEAPATQAAIDAAIPADNDPTPVISTPRPAASRSSSGGGNRPAATPAPKTVAPAAPPKPVAFANLAAPGALPKAWAVVVGVQAYQGRTHPTVGGRGDAAAMVTALKQSGWPADHILELVDGDATAPKIRQAMQWLVQHSAPDTFSLFHFSGHVCIPSTGPCGSGMHLWTVENQFISDVEVGNALRPLQGKAWVDIAGCEAAAFDKGISSADRLFTGSSTASEKSYENPDWHQSVWTAYSVDQAMLQGQADTNGDKRVTVWEAVNWAAPHAVDFTRGGEHGSQHPVISGGDTWRGSALPDFAKPPPAPPSAPPPNNGGGGGGQQPAPAPSCSGLTKGILCR